MAEDHPHWHVRAFRTARLVMDELADSVEAAREVAKRRVIFMQADEPAKETQIHQDWKGRELISETHRTPIDRSLPNDERGANKVILKPCDGCEWTGAAGEPGA